MMIAILKRFQEIFETWRLPCIALVGKRWTGVALVLLMTLSCLATFQRAFARPALAPLRQATIPPPTLPNGVAAGDVTQESAVLWARSTVTGVITFTYGINLPTMATHITRTAMEPMLPVTVTVAGLTPGIAYSYQVVNGSGALVQGRFRTAANAGDQTGLRFGVSGDWRGELGPYPALTNAADSNLDFFVELGDTIYADYPSPAVPISQATTLAEYRLKHSEVYSTRLGLNTLAELRTNTAILAMIDDHEVINNFSGGANTATDLRFPNTGGLINDTPLFEIGLQAFHEFNPVQAEFYPVVGGDGRMDNERKLYRYRTFGDTAALFLLDNRSFRDKPIAALNPDSQLDIFRFLFEAFAAGRTLLGSQQLADLKHDLLDAQQKGIVWKFVLTPEPIQNLSPAGGEDRFEGYAAERTDLLRYLNDNKISNVVFVAADIHGAVVNNLTYQLSAGGAQIATAAFEVTTGPVAFDAPFGPTVVALAAQSGIITPTTVARYDSLPVAPDPDNTQNDKDDLVKAAINQILQQLSYETVGLDGSPINASLLHGDYLAVHTFGWTEFAIDQESLALTVTTYGVDAYTAADLAANPDAILARTPTIVSQFRVIPSGLATAPIYLPVMRR